MKYMIVKSDPSTVHTVQYLFADRVISWMDGYPSAFDLDDVILFETIESAQDMRIRMERLQCML